MQGSRTAKASLLPAPKARRTRALRTRRPNNTCMTAPKAGGGYAAALQPQSAEAPGQGEQHKRQRTNAASAGQPPPPAPPAPPAPVQDATAGAAAGAVAGAPAGAAYTQPLAGNLGAIVQAVHKLQEEQASSTLVHMQLQSQLSDKEEELLQVQRALHAAKFEREKVLVQNSELRATLQEKQDKEAENIKLRAALKEKMDKEASQQKLTDQLMTHMRQTADCMLRLGYAKQPVDSASAELVVSPGAALSNQATPMSQEVQATQASQASQASEASQASQPQVANSQH